METGWDYYGYDLAETPHAINSPERCADFCYTVDSGCNAFTFHLKLMQCFLKTSTAGRRRESGFVSGMCVKA
jgi:hypothetical protein